MAGSGEDVVNIFLGVFVPHKNKPALWDREAPQESYLHSPELCDPTLYSEYLVEILWTTNYFFILKFFP